MGVCPECGAEINSLRDFYTTRGTYCLLPNGDAENYYEDSTEHEHEYQCPECNEVITSSYEEALRILNSIITENNTTPPKIVDERE
jgi:Fe2+ or Zn2+ uptake regulation protein